MVSNPDEGIPYCVAAMHPDRLTPFFDATPNVWSARGDDAAIRKSARMQRDYEIAAMMTASLRSTLAHMELHRPISEVFDHHAYCDADAAMHSDPHDPRYGIRSMLAYRATLLRINLQHALVVHFRWVGIDPVNGDIDATRAIDLAEVCGMCLPDNCTGGLGRGTTYFRGHLRRPGPAERRADARGERHAGDDDGGVLVAGWSGEWKHAVT